MYILENKFKKINTAMQGLLIFFLILTTGYLFSSIDKPLFESSKQDTALNLNSKFLKVISLGNRRLLADLLWIQTLIESDLEHYKAKDLNSWIYLRLKTITELDSLFKEAYLFGGQYLSVIKDDIKGATVIYEKGLDHYPYDFHLNLYAGLHFYLEVGDYEKSIKYLTRIRNLPNTPSTIRSILARLHMKQNNLDIALQLLVTQLKGFKPGTRLYKKTWKSLYAVKAQIDLECLNADKSNCNTRDLENNPYLKVGNKYIASKEWKPFKLKIMTRKQGK